MISCKLASSLTQGYFTIGLPDVEGPSRRPEHGQEVSSSFAEAELWAQPAMPRAAINRAGCDFVEHRALAIYAVASVGTGKVCVGAPVTSRLLLDEPMRCRDANGMLDVHRTQLAPNAAQVELNRIVFEVQN